MLWREPSGNKSLSIPYAKDCYYLRVPQSATIWFEHFGSKPYQGHPHLWVVAGPLRSSLGKPCEKTR